MLCPKPSRPVEVTFAYPCALAPARPFPGVARDRLRGSADSGRLFPVTSSPLPSPHLGGSPTPLRASYAPGLQYFRTRLRPVLQVLPPGAPSALRCPPFLFVPPAPTL